MDFSHTPGQEDENAAGTRTCYKKQQNERIPPQKQRQNTAPRSAEAEAAGQFDPQSGEDANYPGFS